MRESAGLAGGRMIGGRTTGWDVTVWMVGLELAGEDEGRRTMDGRLPDMEVSLRDRSATIAPH